VNGKLLSVLIPNFNNVDYIEKCLDAVLSQNYAPLEVIVVDDASTDGSRDVIRSYLKKDTRVRALRNRRNRGVVYTLNRALSHAGGAYVYGGASDDYVAPGFFEKAMDSLGRHPEAGLCFGYSATFSETSHEVVVNTIPLAQIARFFPPDELADAFGRIAIPGHSYVVPGNSSIWKREEFLKVGGYRNDLRWHSDWFTLQVVALRHGAYFMPETCAYTRWNPVSYSSMGQRHLAKQMVVLKELLRLVKEPQFRDVFPRFQKGFVLSQFAPNLVRLVVQEPEFWELDAVLLIKNSLLEFWHKVIEEKEANVRQGTIACLRLAVQQGDVSVPGLIRLLNGPDEIKDLAKDALTRVGKLPSVWSVFARRLTDLLKKVPRKIRGTLRRLVAFGYRKINYKLYHRLNLVEHLMRENRQEICQLRKQLQRLRHTAMKRSRPCLLVQGKPDVSQSPKQADGNAADSAAA
jgi:glycosyltransferase involved in cell wall biosynthesis